MFAKKNEGSTESHPTVDVFNIPRHFSSVQDIGRKHPARGVHIYSGQPTIVFLTVCSENRNPWLADPAVHENLRAAWQSAQA